MLGSYKDFNDLHVANIPIHNLQSVPLDMACLDVMLEDCNDKQAEYNVASKFCATVNDGMIKADIAELLSKRWHRDIADIKEYLSVKVDTAEELRANIRDFDNSFKDMRLYLSEPGTGLGFPSLDYSINGVKRKEVVVLGAYSNHGKSFVAAKIIAYRILHENDNVLLFSMEMPAGQFLAEIVKEILHVNDDGLVEMISSNDGGAIVYERVKAALDKKLRIIDMPGQGIAEIESYISLLASEGFQTDFVVYDHFHLMPTKGDPFEAMRENANGLHTIAKKFNVRFLMLAQFNEESIKRVGNKKNPHFEPMITDIKGSNELKAIADIVLLLWRPYKTDIGIDEIKREEQKNISKIKLGKSRRKPRGSQFFTYEYDDKTTALKEVGNPRLAN